MTLVDVDDDDDVEDVVKHQQGLAKDSGKEAKLPVDIRRYWYIKRQ